MQELEDAGLVREVESLYAAPVVVAPKKDESAAWTDLRYATDYRRLNEVTIRDQYPTPVPEEILAKMEGATFFQYGRQESVPPSTCGCRHTTATGLPCWRAANDLESYALRG